ncbi:hypothetical protein J1614_008153 [Plenodomus biglobosus]|nr:hypothetical protein J1614_008153 [Plenodomus biglobosus]
MSTLTRKLGLPTLGESGTKNNLKLDQDIVSTPQTGPSINCTTDANPLVDCDGLSVISGVSQLEYLLAIKHDTECPLDAS